MMNYTKMSGAAGLSAAKRRRASGAFVSNNTFSSNQNQAQNVRQSSSPNVAATPTARVLYT